MLADECVIQPMELDNTPEDLSTWAAGDKLWTKVSVSFDLLRARLTPDRSKIFRGGPQWSQLHSPAPTQR